MNKTQATSWVKALLSGKFSQATGRLRKKKDGKIVGHCCLGVLGVLGKCSEIQLDDKAYLPTELMNKYGMSSASGKPSQGRVKVRKGNTYVTFGSLSEANDKGVSFRSIATWIKKNYERL